MIPRLRPFLAAFALAILLGAPAPSHARSSSDIYETGLPPGSAKWGIDPLESCPGDSLRFVFSWCPNCAHLDRAEEVSGQGIVIELTTHSNTCDTTRCVPESRAFPLGAHSAGHYQLTFTLIVHDTLGHTAESHPTVSFDVSQCGGGSGGPLPYVDAVRIVGPGGNPPCAGDSIRVLISGHFNNTCHSLKRADWVLLPNARPALVRLLVDVTGCTREVCLSDSIPWHAELTLPPFVAGDWLQPIALYTVSCADTFPREPDHIASVPFTVRSAEQCGTPAPCFIARFPHGDAKCDTHVDTEHPAQVTLEVASGVAIAGLQGVLRVEPAGLKITQLEAVGPAAGMHLSWHPSTDGAAFVMFADDTTRIPAIPPNWSDWHGAPVLRVTLAPAGSAQIPPITYVVPQELIASDAQGHGVRNCPNIMTTVYDPRLDVFARVCAERPCDANGDGRSDVRDLVLMVRCLHQSCPDSARFDCDDNGAFGLDDVICCALAILRQHAPPDSNAAHPAGEVAASLGTPRLDGKIVHVPLRVTGSQMLGSALMQLRFPSDRFDLTAVTSDAAPSRVLAIHSVEGSDLAVAFMDLFQLGLVPIDARQAFPGTSPETMEFDLQFTLKPGARAGGEIELLDAQYTGPAGERLAIQVLPSSMPVVPPDVAQLSAARPNPFARETRFSVDLPRGAHVQLSVHDLSGRRVASLFDGALPAGRSEFTWNGLTDRGGRAAHGVYFVHLNAGGEIASRKIVVIGGP